MAGDQVGAVAVRGEADGAGVRDAHRDAVDADGQPHPEPLDHLLDGGGEPLPLHVRFGAGEQQEGGAGGVLHQVEFERGDLVVGVAVALEGEQRPAGPVVDEPVVVEAGDGLVREVLQQLVDDLLPGLPGVDVSLEVVEHDEPGRLLGQRGVHRGEPLRLPCVQILRVSILHCDRSSSCP